MSCLRIIFSCINYYFCSKIFVSFSSPTPTSIFFFFNDPATPEIYTLSLHDALPIFNADEIGYLSKTKASVCACPTTERNLGDGVAPADALYASGVGICFGSDSNVQIDPLEDARSLEYHLRLNRLERVVLPPDHTGHSLARRLFASTTETCAASLGAPSGSLELTRQADFFTVDLDDPSIAGAGPPSLLNHIVFSLERTAVRDVCIGGELVVRDGHHLLEGDIVREFGTVQKDLWGSSA